ncbi:MAG TPA: DsbC family protein [Gammaproteobacteria bacterium]
MLRLSRAAAAAVLLSLLAPGLAGAQAMKPEVRAKLATQFEVAPEEIRPSPVPGLYEVASGSEIGYVSADGRYYVDGDLFEIETRTNLSENRRLASRALLLKDVPDEQTVVFSPKGYKYTLHVFTDVDCGYCRKLHAEIAELNRLGVRVRYLMYPRSGPGSESWARAEAVMCSADRRDALTRAKRGEAVKAPACENPVARQYELGREVGIRGTPGIITEQGRYIAGYLPAPQLVEHVKRLDEQG